MNLFPWLVFRIALLGAWGATPAPGAAPFVSAAPAGPPLLVIVERGPELAVDAGSVRAAIAAELGARVVAPTAAEASALAAAAPRTDVLLVALRRDRLVLTLRGPGDRELTRAVAAPADPAAQMKVVAWLAGNLARDQLSTLTLAQAAPGASATPSAPAPCPPSERPAPPPVDGLSTPGASATQPPVPDGPPPPDPPATEPPALVRRSAAEPAMTSPRRLAGEEESPSWTVTLSGGGGVALRVPWQVSESAGLPSGASTVAGVEVHRHFGAWFLGLVADYGPRPYHQIAGALLVGRQGRLGVVRLEGSGGFGVEQFNGVLVYPPSLDGRQSAQFDTRGRAYARAAFSGIIGVARQVDAVAQVIAHATMSDQTNAGAIVATLGLRLTLP